HKGEILTAISEFWFNKTRDIISNHMITSDVKKFPGELNEYHQILAGRSMIVEKAERVDVECVVRGYLSGSGWKEYQVDGSVCGIALPPGLVESEKLPEPIFTPAIKAETGHDENISEEKLVEIVGGELKTRLKEASLSIYNRASKMAESKGIIIADTKFEFGFHKGELILIDELLTPDSSRFWPLDEYEAGNPQKSLDKQLIRDYLEDTGWNKEPPAPPLPWEIVKTTSTRYIEAYERLTGIKFMG
ncbi:MAG: phosphoribosylaminoimidazolesuccinocarboxamide synthase, partial [Candidatus Altiarchaeales archaeon]|nr:phosphoribosylaminoimidazolesuccinocarboxamide synthase [Candidatus Altiarchaeales archaeon]